MSRLEVFFKKRVGVKVSVWKREMGFYSQLQQHSSSILWFEQKPQNTKASAQQQSEPLGTHRQSITGVVRFTQLCSPGTIPWEDCNTDTAVVNWQYAERHL